MKGGDITMNGPDVKVDNSHVSQHFIEGKFDTPIVQKIRVGDQSIKLNTPVDDKGNVGPSTFDSFRR